MKAKLRGIEEVVTDRGDKRFFLEMELLIDASFINSPAYQKSINELREFLGKQINIDVHDANITKGVLNGHSVIHEPSMCTKCKHSPVQETFFHD